MKMLITLLLLGITVISCDISNSNQSTEITYRVVDHSESPQRKEITYIHGDGAQIIVQSVEKEWERTFMFKERLDSKLSVRVLSDKYIDVSIYIYKDGALIKEKESKNAYSLTVTHLN